MGRLHVLFNLFQSSLYPLDVWDLQIVPCYGGLIRSHFGVTSHTVRGSVFPKAHLPSPSRGATRGETCPCLDQSSCLVAYARLPLGERNHGILTVRIMARKAIARMPTLIAASALEM